MTYCICCNLQRRRTIRGMDEKYRVYCSICGVTIRDAILTCAQKRRRVSLIYRKLLYKLQVKEVPACIANADLISPVKLQRCTQFLVPRYDASDACSSCSQERHSQPIQENLAVGSAEMICCVLSCVAQVYFVTTQPICVAVKSRSHRCRARSVMLRHCTVCERDLKLSNYINVMYILYLKVVDCSLNSSSVFSHELR